MRAMIALIQANLAGKSPRFCMTPIAGKPLLQWQIESLARSGARFILVVCSKEASDIQDTFGDGSKFGLKISYVLEERSSGTGGAMYYAAKTFKESFVFLEGDVLLDVDFDAFLKAHKKHDAIITALARPVPCHEASDMLIARENGKILKLLPGGEKREEYYENLSYGGVYAVSKFFLETFVDMEEPIEMDFADDLFAPSVAVEGAYAYRSAEYVRRLDEGNQKELEEAVEKGVMFSRNRRSVKRAIFLDRDGVLNIFGNFVTKPEMLNLKDDAADALKKINASTYLAVCITNQPVVARGETTVETLTEIHYRLQDPLGAGGAYLDGLYYCPHHPDKGFPGEVPELKIDCDCRKPKIGLLIRAKKDFNIDLASSWFVGDTHQDVQTGINAGCRTILITSGDPNPSAKYKEAEPDYTCENLAEAVDIILSQEKKN